MNLLSAPIELRGDWKASPPNDVSAVVSRMRSASLDGIPLCSDRQPNGLIVDRHPAGPPAIWLHGEPRDKAWIIVDISDLQWCQLSYQFGHELGHVLCNSWEPFANAVVPCRWLEEALVEAFAIRGLGLLARSWLENPPFTNDQAYGAEIEKYRDDLVGRYEAASSDTGSRGKLSLWYKEKRSTLEKIGGLNAAEGPIILALVARFNEDQTLISDYGAVNRWPGRSGVPVEDYLSLWESSCKQIGSGGKLPVAIRAMLGLS